MTKNNNLLNVNTVITDLDDTLIPFAKAYACYAQALVEGIAKASGISKKDIAKSFNEFYVKKGIFQFEDTLNENLCLKEKFPNEDLKQRFSKEIINAQETMAKNLKPHDNVVETLKSLKEKGVKLVLFTAGPASFTMDKLKHAGLENIFEKIYAVEDKRQKGQVEAIEKHPSKEWDKVRFFARSPKSSVDAYETIIKEVGADKNTTIMMGDHPIQDIFYAKKAGIKTVLIKGYRDLNPEQSMMSKVLAKEPVKKVMTFIKNLIKKGCEKSCGANLELKWPSLIEKHINNTKDAEIKKIVNLKHGGR